MKLIYLLAGLAVLLAAPSAPAQQPNADSAVGVISFDYIDHIFLTVTVNDSLDAVLVYDPVQRVLLDEGFTERHGISTYGGEEVGYGGPVRVGGAGSAEHIVHFARDLTVGYGRPTDSGGVLERSFPLTPVIPLDAMMAVALGRRVDGLFGIDILADYVLEFDFEGERFVLHDTTAFRPPPEATEIPITPIGRAGKPSVPVTVHLPDGEWVSGQFVLDFGMGGAIRLTTGFTETHELAERITPNVASGSETGLGGALQSLVARTPAVSIGGLRVEEPMVSMAQEKEGADAYPEHDGLIGLGLMDRYRMFYDAPGERLWLAPTERTGRPYLYLETGLQWEPLGRGVGEAEGLVVRSVREGSPAAEAGIQSGDGLVSVDGVEASGWTRREWRAAVEQSVLETGGEGALELSVLRDGVSRGMRLNVARQF